MLPGDRLICALVEPSKVGSTFSKWLLHVTIVPWFRLTDSSETVARGLTQTLKTVAPFKATVVGRSMFGPRKNRPAVLLEPSLPFETVENKVRSYLHKKHAWLVDETTRHPRQFRPHVTVQGDKSLNLGDMVRCDTLYIVEQKGDYKEIVSEVRLGS